MSLRVKCRCLAMRGTPNHRFVLVLVVPRYDILDMIYLDYAIGFESGDVYILVNISSYKYFRLAGQVHIINGCMFFVYVPVPEWKF